MTVGHMPGGSLAGSGYRLNADTAQSFSEGHPDSVADQIADAVVDLVIEHDPAALIHCHVLIAPGFVAIGGQLRSSLFDEKAMKRAAGNAAEQVLRRSCPEDLVDATDVRVRIDVDQKAAPSFEGAAPADRHTSAYGYATREMPERIPFAQALAHILIGSHSRLRCNRDLPWLGPSASCQVTVGYDCGRPMSIDTVAFMLEHDPKVSAAQVWKDVRDLLIEPMIPEPFSLRDTEILISGNAPSSGVSGRKAVSDFYGGRAPQCAVGLSGIGPNSIERIAPYQARWMARHLVDAGFADEATIHLAYSPGKVAPSTLLVDTHDSSAISGIALEIVLRRVFDLSPDGIRTALNLWRPIYGLTSVYGQVGRAIEQFTWEHSLRVPELRQLLEHNKAANLGRKKLRQRQIVNIPTPIFGVATVTHSDLLKLSESAERKPGEER